MPSFSSAAITCDDPGFPHHGDRVGISLKFGATLNFTCDPGYKMIGSKQLQCLASGRWLGHVPKCERKYVEYKIYIARY